MFVVDAQTLLLLAVHAVGGLLVYLSAKCSLGGYVIVKWEQTILKMMLLSEMEGMQHSYAI